jgi:hypothetical protein
MATFTAVLSKAVSAFGRFTIHDAATDPETVRKFS